MTIDEKAKAAHDIWAHWMKYMFSCGDYKLNKTWVMPKEKLERWERLMKTPFEELTEQEKKSDYEIAQQFLK